MHKKIKNAIQNYELFTFIPPHLPREVDIIDDSISLGLYFFVFLTQHIQEYMGRRG